MWIILFLKNYYIKLTWYDEALVLVVLAVWLFVYGKNSQIIHIFQRYTCIMAYLSFFLTERWKGSFKFSHSVCFRVCDGSFFSFLVHCLPLFTLFWWDMARTGTYVVLYIFLMFVCDKKGRKLGFPLHVCVCVYCCCWYCFKNGLQRDRDEDTQN